MEIEGKRVLLTGATGGLGRAIAVAIADRGGRLILSARRREELEELAAGLPGGGHSVAVSDLAEPGAAEQLVAEAGQVDILVANAGLPGTGVIEDFSTDEIARAIRVNLEAPVIMSQALVPAMKERGGGHLVFVSSLSGKVASPRGSIYNATKFGLRGFALGLRQDQVIDGTGIGVSLVLPGFIRDAGMFADGGAKLPPGAGTGTPEQVGDGRDQGDRRRSGRDRRGPTPHAGDLEPRPRLPGIRRPLAAQRRQEGRRPARSRQRREALSPRLPARSCG